MEAPSSRLERNLDCKHSSLSCVVNRGLFGQGVVEQWKGQIIGRWPGVFNGFWPGAFDIWPIEALLNSNSIRCYAMHICPSGVKSTRLSCLESSVGECG